MKRPSYRDVFDELETRDCLTDDERNRVESNVEQGSDSLLLSALAGLGTWLAASFLACFVGMWLQSELGLIVTAVVFLSTAMGLHHHWEPARGSMGRQVVLALSFSSQLAMAGGLSVLTMNWEVATVGTVLFSALAYATISGRAHRVVSALVIFGTWATYVFSAGSPPFWQSESETDAIQFAAYLGLLMAAVGVPAVVFGARRWLSARVARALRPAAYSGAVVAAIFSGQWVVDVLTGPVAGTQKAIVAVAAVVMVAIATIEDRRRQRLHWPEAVAAAVVVLGLVTEASLLCSAWLVGLGIWRRRPVLSVLGWIALAVHLVWFYLGLSVSAMEMSASLVAGGAVFLGLWWFLGRTIDDDGEAP